LLEYLAAGNAWRCSQSAKFLLGPTDGANLSCRRKEMFDGLVDVRHRRIIAAARKQMRSLRRLMAKREPRQPKALARNFVLNCHFRSTITAASFKRLDLGSQ
jgi:hypothetical protein